jgi:hypothetical protein
MDNHDDKYTYFSLESHQGNEVEECWNLVGHDWSHDCKKKWHTCMKICSLFGMFHLILCEVPHCDFHHSDGDLQLVYWRIGSSWGNTSSWSPSSSWHWII